MKQSETGSDLIEAHGKQFLYFTCVVGARDGSACIDVRPQPRSLFEHFLVLLILRTQRENTASSVNYTKKKKIISTKTQSFFFLVKMMLTNQMKGGDQSVLKYFLTWFATTASCGSSGSAAARSACSDNSTVRRVIAAALGETDEKLELLFVMPGQHTRTLNAAGHRVQTYLTHHWSFKMSRHIAPVTELILGCQILVMKRT